MFFKTEQHQQVAKRLAWRLTNPRPRSCSGLQLHNGSRIAIIGGGPAGAMCAFFLLRLAKRLDIDFNVDIFEPRHFDNFGPAGCNHCGGVVSESLVQLLALEGICLPAEVMQTGIDGYVLHTDVGSVHIATPLHEKRIATVYRGGGPRGLKRSEWHSFDQYLLDLAQNSGAHLSRELVLNINWHDGKPCIVSNVDKSDGYDLVIVATGVNSKLIQRIAVQGIGYKPPRTTATFISEWHVGEDLVRQYLGTSMHVFLLDLPGLKFAALIPKRQFVTMCLLGKNIDQNLVQAFLNSKEVTSCLPPTAATSNLAACHCFPHINIASSPRPFADRLLFIGDSGVTRLYKDGIGAAYRTAKAAANAIVIGGVAADDFQKYFMPICNKLNADNAIGRIIFQSSDLIQNMRFSRRAIVHMVAQEQSSSHMTKHLSTILWDVFTGSAPYREILWRGLHPEFLARLSWNLLSALNSFK